MRILFCNKYNFRFSGTEAYLFELLDLLRGAGHEVALFAMQSGNELDRGYVQYLVPRLDFKKQQPVWTRARQAAHVIYSRSVRRSLAYAIEDFQPDIAHIRNIYHHLSPSILWEFRARDIPVIYQVNDLKLICPTNTLVSHDEICELCRGGAFWHVAAQRCYGGSPSAALVLMAEAYVHKWLNTYPTCVTRVIAPTDFVRRKLIENGWNSEKIDVLFHFQRVAQENRAAVAANAPILYFGRLSPEKGVADLIHAMQSNPHIPLLIAGDGPQRSQLETLARHLCLANVTFGGRLEGAELDRAIARSRFTIFPSHAGEVLGKSILESYAHGKPVIATDLGSRREVVVDKRTGLLYPHGNVRQLAEKIASLYPDSELIDELGRAGRNLLVERHSPAEHLCRLTSIYERVRGNSKASAAAGGERRRKLRVAFIGGRGVVSRYSGIESFYEEAGRELAALGHEVTVYCRNYFTPAISSHNGMRLVRLPTIRSKHLDTFVHTFLSTLHAIFGHYDVIHYHTLGPALFCWIPRFCGLKTIVTVQGLDWRRRKWGRVAAAVLRVAERAAITCPHATIVVSRTLQTYFQEKYGRGTILVPNGTRLRERRREKYIPTMDLKPDEYVLFLGRFSPEKNCDLLIRAYEQIDTTAKLVLAGGSSYSDAYVHELCRHASPRVRFLEWVTGEDLEELIAQAMIFVLPSDMEGLSLALLDAMGAGLCVLASDIPENREVVEGAGFTFQAGDEADLAKKLAFLISNAAARKQAGQAARERIRQRYLWPAIAREIEIQYLRLLMAPMRCDGDKANEGGSPSFRAA